MTMDQQQPIEQDQDSSHPPQVWTSRDLHSSQVDDHLQDFSWFLLQVDELPHGDIQPDVPRIADHKLLKELSIRFDRQQRRWTNYSQLCGFFLIVILLLFVLWIQRGAQVGFQVHKAVRMNIVDSFQYSRFNSPTEILTWLERLADQHWVDPPCGDGQCDQPFEFPSYSRFGCRADCSSLSLVALDVHPLQVDLYFDFLHSTDGAVVSLAPTALLDLASWNICPLSNAPGAPFILLHRLLHSHALEPVSHSTWYKLLPPSILFFPLLCNSNGQLTTL